MNFPGFKKARRVAHELSQEHREALKAHNAVCDVAWPMLEKGRNVDHLLDFAAGIMKACSCRGEPL